jgi:hypothetical protein
MRQIAVGRSGIKIHSPKDKNYIKNNRKDTVNTE